MPATRTGIAGTTDQDRRRSDAVKEIREACNNAMDLLLRGPSPATRRGRSGRSG